MIGIVDYGAGNLRSVANALEHIKAPFRLCRELRDLSAVTKVILPGVGHFAAAAMQLARTGMLQGLRDWASGGRPVLGICLGLQLLFEASAEGPGTPGLGLLAGRVVRLQAKRVPHMGWNEVTVVRECPLLCEGSSDYFYFAHSFVAFPTDAGDIAGMTDVDDSSVPAVVGGGIVWGVQFHPEKSGEAGLRLLARFAQC